MAAIGDGWQDGAWVEAGWISGAWASGAAAVVFALNFLRRRRVKLRSKGS